MKNINYLILTCFALLSLSLSACGLTGELMGGVQGNGAIKTEVRNHVAFTGIDLSSNAEVILTQATGDNSVKVEGDDNLLQYVKTSVSNDVLHVELTKSCRFSGKLKVYISMSKLTFVDASGAINLRGTNQLITDDISLHLSGASKVKLDIQTLKIKIDASGASNITLMGTAEKFKLDLSGSSNIDAQNFVSKDVIIDASGASDIKVNATDLLDVDLSGSGKVAYKGTPKSMKTDVSGAAKVVQM